MADGKITSFEQLIVWQLSQKLAVDIYKVTGNFPKVETFGLTTQLRRASASISANIAEGFGRRTIKDKMSFYTIAYGSLLETKNFLYLANKIGYIDKQILDSLLESIVSLQKQINSFMKSVKMP